MVQTKFSFKQTFINTKKVKENWFCNKFMVQAKFRFKRTFINTKKFTENWFYNKIIVQANIPFQMDLLLFQKCKNYNRYMYNYVGVSRLFVLRFLNKS